MQYLNVPKINFIEMNKQLAGKPRQMKKGENNQRPKLLGKLSKFEIFNHFC